VLSDGLRRADIVAELGTNRYAVLLAGAGGYDAGRVASRIRLSTPSEVGVAVFPKDGDSLADLVMAALATMRASSARAS
jgi:GGDEF domain-containing protein